MSIKIVPTKLTGSVNVPSSKSFAHRAIISACLAHGVSKIDNINFSDDINATCDAMISLGAKIKRDNNSLIIEGIDNLIDKNIDIDCIESGSTLRFLVPIACALNKGINHFIGRGKLGQRPMGIYEKLFKENNLYFVDKSSENENNYLDLYVKGRLKEGEYHIDGSVSSQFITGLIYALSLNSGDSTLIIDNNLASLGYIDITLDVLKTFGVEIINKDYKSFYIKGGQKYKAINYIVEGDYSQEAFFEVANYIGNKIEIKGMNENSKQGDREIVRMIMDLKTKENNVFDCQNCPDIVPILAIASSLTKGVTKIVNIERLKIKECDRLKATYEVLTLLGVKVEMTNSSLTVYGVDTFCGGKFTSYHDHRMAMMIAIASTRANGDIEIDDEKCVSKSYPDFFKDFVSLGGIIR